MNRKKHTARSRTIQLAALSALLLAPLGAQAEDKKIDVTVVSGTAGYKIVFQNSECPGEPGNKGCIKTKKGVKNWLKWDLDSAAKGEGWELSKLRLKIEDLPLEIRACAISDFDLDPSDGTAKSFKDGKVKNENDCGQAYEVAYDLHAHVPGTNKTADSDPIIRNEGRR